MNLVQALDTIDRMQRRGAMAVKAFYGMKTTHSDDISSMITDLLAFAKANRGNNPKMICSLSQQRLEIAEHDVISSERSVAEVEDAAQDDLDGSLV